MIIDIRRIEEIVANNRKSVKTESLDMKFDGTYFIPTTSSDNNKITVPMKYGDDELAGLCIGLKILYDVALLSANGLFVNASAMDIEDIMIFSSFSDIKAVIDDLNNGNASTIIKTPSQQYREFTVYAVYQSPGSHHAKFNKVV